MRRMGPLLMLSALVVAVSAALVAAVALGVSPDDAVGAASPVLALGAITWVVADAQARRRVPCYDLGLLAGFFFPLSLPCYVFWSRGPRGIVLLIALGALWILPGIAAGIADLALHGFP